MGSTHRWIRKGFDDALEHEGLLEQYGFVRTLDASSDRIRQVSELPNSARARLLLSCFICIQLSWQVPSKSRLDFGLPFSFLVFIHLLGLFCVLEVASLTQAVIRLCTEGRCSHAPLSQGRHKPCRTSGALSTTKRLVNPKAYSVAGLTIS